MPKVSVIIPNYNHAKYLPQRIESVLQQTYTDFEVIILDDCSTDNSREIIQKYQGHPKVSTVLFSETNSGSTFIQWKKGFERAQGDYIWIAESDDVAAPQFLEALVHALEENSETAVAYCPTFWIDEQDEIILRPSSIKVNLHRGEDFIRKQFILGNAIPNASMAVFRKDVLSKINFPDLIKFRYCGDWFFWVSLSKGSEIYQHDQALNYYRRHSQSVSSASEKEGLFFLEGLLILNQIKKIVKLNPKELFLISKEWGFKLFNHRREHNQVGRPILKVFMKHLPFGLLFFVLYAMKYHRRPTQA